MITSHATSITAIITMILNDPHPHVTALDAWVSTSRHLAAGLAVVHGHVTAWLQTH